MRSMNREWPRTKSLPSYLQRHPYVWHTTVILILTWTGLDGDQITTIVMSTIQKEKSLTFYLNYNYIYNFFFLFGRTTKLKIRSNVYLYLLLGL